MMAWSRIGKAALLALLAAPALAAEVDLYLMEVPPLTLNEPDRKGIGGDLVMEALKRAGYTARLQVMPSNRAMAQVQHVEARDVLIIPLARQKEREAYFTWIAPIARVQRSFFSLDRKVQSFDEARATFRTIAVARGTAGRNILREQGFPDSQLYEVADTISAARMLMLHRVDAWYGPVLQFREWMRETDPQHQVQSGAMLGTTLNYLACSKVCDPVLRTRLADAIDKLTRDGTARAIEARYEHGEQP
jgi:polar amino acid transport system substrate-binding protein